MNDNIETVQHLNIIEIILTKDAIDEFAFEHLSKLFNDYIENGINKFIINLKDIEIINSSNLNVLIKSFTLIRNSGGEMYIVNISDKINQVLILTKLNSVLNIATSIKNALEHLNK